MRRKNNSFAAFLQQGREYINRKGAETQRVVKAYVEFLCALATLRFNGLHRDLAPCVLQNRNCFNLTSMTSMQ